MRKSGVFKVFLQQLKLTDRTLGAIALTRQSCLSATYKRYNPVRRFERFGRSPNGLPKFGNSILDDRSQTPDEVRVFSDEVYVKNFKLLLLRED
ncbi:MAG: hypothetical protein D6680_02810 [Cyanobacteria bacterium J007]|jgi:hypothetical protein|nr:MAG: hypothetical protein D6680_02810 [Cyanobacteria bacterium J007]